MLMSTRFSWIYICRMIIYLLYNNSFMMKLFIRFFKLFINYIRR